MLNEREKKEREKKKSDNASKHSCPFPEVHALTPSFPSEKSDLDNSHCTNVDLGVYLCLLTKTLRSGWILANLCNTVQ